MKPTPKSAAPYRAVTILIHNARLGSPSAFEEIYHLYKGQVYRLCLRVSKSVPDSEDLTQEIFIQVRRKLHSFRGDSAFGTWLYRVAFNTTMMFLRRRGPEEPCPDLSLERTAAAIMPPPPFYGYAPVRILALKRAIAALPTGRRNVVILHDINGLSHREVGLQLGITASTSKTQLHHAHLTLRSLLNGSHPPRAKAHVSRAVIQSSERSAA
jgi:RNA polymerase sigma-70 factor (ECF subfamily)